MTRKQAEALGWTITKDVLRENYNRWPGPNGNRWPGSRLVTKWTGRKPSISFIKGWIRSGTMRGVLLQIAVVEEK